MTSRKTIEEKVTNCASNVQFLKVAHKESGEGFLAEEKVMLSEKTFTNNHDFVILYSCRIIGTRANIEGYLNDSKTVISSTLKSLMDLDLSQCITKDNYELDEPVNVYNFTKEKGEYIFIKNGTSTKSTLFSNEVKRNRAEKQKKRETDLMKRIPLSDIGAALYILKNEPHKIDKIPISSRSKTIGGAVVAPKRNILMERVDDAKTKDTWLDISNCKESGSGVVTCNDKPKSAFSVQDIPELSRCFYTPKKDTNPQSPTRGMKNVGVVNFLYYFFKNHPGYEEKSKASCSDLFKKSYFTKCSAVSSLPPTSSGLTMSASSLGIPSLA